MNIKNYLRIFIGFAILLLLHGCASMQGRTVLSSTSKPIARGTYRMPPAGQDVIGETFTVTAEPGDTVDTLAQRYDMGALELIDANPQIKPYRIQPDTKVIIPREFILPPEQYRRGIVINVAALRLYYFNPDGTVMTYPVALGRNGWHTPLGRTSVYRKQEAPVWNVPESIRKAHFEKYGTEHPRVVPAGPENPLGDYAIYLHLPGYLIHGTNNPSSIGRLVSSGCIRMYNQDVAVLYNYVQRGTPVTIIYYPVKAGWYKKGLYLQVHRHIKHQEGVYQAREKSVDTVVADATKDKPVKLNADALHQALRAQTGIPTQIGQLQ